MRDLEAVIEETDFDFHAVDPWSLNSIAEVNEAKSKVIATIRAIGSQLMEVQMSPGWRARAITARAHAQAKLKDLRTRMHDLHAEEPSKKRAKRDAFAQLILNGVQQLTADEKARILASAVAASGGEISQSSWSIAENRLGRKVVAKTKELLAIAPQEGDGK